MNKTVKKFSIQELCFIKPPKVYGLRFVDYSDYAALEAELARVRAESLRVVPHSAKMPLDELWCDEYLIACQGRVYIREYDTDNFVELSDGPCLDVPEDTIVQPVRLERWEDE